MQFSMFYENIGLEEGEKEEGKKGKMNASKIKNRMKST